MFNILDFIDSRDIRECNRNTEFTPIEQAVLIYHSRGTTVEEKMSAWQELLDTYNEEGFERTRFGKRRFGEKTNRQIIEDTVIAYENALMQRDTVDSVVFEARFYESSHQESDYPVYFSSYKEVLAYIEDEKKSYLEDEGLRECQTEAEIHLKYLGTQASEDTIYYFDNELRMVSILPGTRCLVNDWYGVDELFVYVPLPFKKGDIIRSILPRKIEYGILDSTPDEEYFSIPTQRGDGSDMAFSLYIYEPDEGIGYFDYDHAYPLWYEKCPDGELPEELSMLFLLRDVYQNRMGVGYFLMMYSKSGNKAYERIYGRKKSTDKE